MPMYPEQKQPACSLGLDPELNYVISLSHVLPTQNRSKNNSGYQKKIKILPSITLRCTIVHGVSVVHSGKIHQSSE